MDLRKSLIFTDFLSLRNFWAFSRKDDLFPKSVSHPPVTSCHLLIGLLLLFPHNFNCILNASSNSPNTLLRAGLQHFTDPLPKTDRPSDHTSCFHLLQHVDTPGVPGPPCDFPSLPTSPQAPVWCDREEGCCYVCVYMSPGF